MERVIEQEIPSEEHQLFVGLHKWELSKKAPHSNRLQIRKSQKFWNQALQQIYPTDYFAILRVYNDCFLVKFDSLAC